MKIVICLVAVGGLEPPTSCQYVGRILQVAALSAELHDTPYIYSLIQAAGSNTSLRHTTQSPSALLDLQSGFSIYFVLYIAVARQPYSAFNSHNLPSDLRYYLPALLFTSRPTRGHCWFGNYLVTSGCTYGLGTVSFHSISFEVYFAAVSAQGFARASPPFGGSRCHHRYGLLATHLAIVYSVYSAYLPGLHSARPSAFVEGAGLEPAAHPMLFRESSPRGRTAVAYLR